MPAPWRASQRLAAARSQSCFSVLRRDELGRQRQDLGVARRDHTGTEKGVEILHAAIRAPALRALRAADLARTEVLGAVEGDQQSAVQALERRQAIGGGNALHPLDEQSIEGAGRIAVEHLADVVVARNRRHAEQGLAVRPAVPLGQCPLVPQERRALHEEHRERRQANVRHGVAVAQPLAFVVEPGADLFQFRQQFLQCAHAAVESHFTRPRKAPFMTPSQFGAPPAPPLDANATQPH